MPEMAIHCPSLQRNMSSASAIAGNSGGSSGTPFVCTNRDMASGKGTEAEGAAIWARLAKSRDAQDYQTQVAVGKPVRTNLPFLQRPRPERFDDHVRCICEPQQGIWVFGVAEVEVTGRLFLESDRHHIGGAITSQPIRRVGPPRLDARS